MERRVKSSINVISPLLREQSSCCDAPLIEKYLDLQCSKCQRVYKRPSTNDRTRKSFEK